MTRSLKNIEAGFGQVQSALEGAKRFTEAAGGIFAARELVEYGKRALETANNLEELATQVGATTKQVQALQFAGSLAGADQEKTNLGLVTFGKNLAEAADRSSQLHKELVAYGIATTDAQGRTLPFMQALGNVADFMARTGDETKRLSVAAQLFGRQDGPAMSLALQAGRKGLQDMADEAERVGAIMSEDLVKKAADAANRLQTIGLVARTSFDTGILEVFVGGLSDTAADLEKVHQSAEAFGKAVGTALSAAASGAQFLADHMNAVLSVLAAVAAAKAAEALIGVATAIAKVTKELAELESVAAALDLLAARWKTILVIGAGIAALAITWANLGDKVRGAVDELKDATGLFDGGQTGSAPINTKADDLIAKLTKQAKYQRELASAYDVSTGSGEQFAKVVALSNDLLAQQDIMTPKLQKAMIAYAAAQERVAKTKAFADARDQEEQAGKLADAYQQGAGAVANMQDAISLYNLALKAGTPISLQRAKTEIDNYNRWKIAAHGAVSELAESVVKQRQAAQVADATKKSWDLGDQIEQLQTQIGLVGQSAGKQREVLAVLQVEQDIRRNFPGMDEKERQAWIDKAKAAANFQTTLERSQAAYDAISSFATNAFDTIGNAITQAFATGQIEAVKFGDIAKSILSEVIQLALKLSVINPLANAVLNQNLPTAADVAALPMFGGAGASGSAGLSGQALQAFSVGRALSGGFSQSGFNGIAGIANRGADFLFGTNYAPSLSQQFEGAIPANGFLNAGAFGNAGLSAGLSLVTSLISGKGIGQSALSAGLTGVGAYFGGPIGAIAGSILGSIFGGLFKKKPPVGHLQLLTSASNNPNLFQEYDAAGNRSIANSPFGYVGLAAASKHTPSDLEQNFPAALAKMDQTLAALMSPSQIAATASKLQNYQGLKTSSRGEFEGEVFDVVKDRLQATLNTLIPQSTVAQSLNAIERSNDNLDQLVQASADLLSQRKSITDVLDSYLKPSTLSASGQALADLKTQFDGFRTSATQLGVSLAEINKAQALAVKNLKTGFLSGLSDQLLQLTNPKQFDINQVNAGIADLIKQAKDLGLYSSSTAMQIDKIKAAQLDQVLAKYATSITDTTSALADAQQKYTDALSAANDNFQKLLDPLQALKNDLAFGSASRESPLSQFKSAQAEFERIAALAKAGNVDAISQFPTISRTFLDQANAYGASPAWASAAAEIKAALSQVVGRIEGTRDAGFQDLGLIYRQVGAATIQTLDKMRQEMVAEIRGLRNELAQVRNNPRSLVQ